MPKVSVIIPVYNRAALIGRAIRSVLDQTFCDFEVIVVDDGSTDTTAQVIKAFGNGIQYVLQKNGGCSVARNRGIQEAKGEYIAFLDSDDYWAPEKLAEQVKILESNKNIGIVYSRMPIINEKGECVGLKPAGVSGKNFQELLQSWGDLPTSTVMTRRECFEKAGMFDPDLPPMEDIDMWIRIARFYELYEIEGKNLAYYYRHDNQITGDNIKVYTGLIKIYTKILKNFQEAPKILMHKRIALNEYMLARTYHDRKCNKEALCHLFAAFRNYPILGIVLFTPEDQWLNRSLKLIKPYGFLFVCILKSVDFRLAAFVPNKNNFKSDEA